MPFDFDHTPDRRSTNSIKWTLYPADVLPLWVADMDFPAPPPVIEALRAAVEHGVFGYEMPSRALRESVAARMQKLYNWDVHPESVIATPGIVSAFYAAAAALCHPGEGYLIQPPVYMPFNDIQKTPGRHPPGSATRAARARKPFELRDRLGEFQKPRSMPAAATRACSCSATRTTPPAKSTPR